jgi:hypothetical protein
VEEERQREARRERYLLEVKRTNELVNESESFDISCKIKAYVSAVEQNDSISEEIIEWISWAKRKADWFDPTKKLEDKILGIRNYSTNSMSKKEF